MKQKFEETSAYREGQFFERLGQMMQNHSTTLDDLSDFLFDHGMEFGFNISSISIDTDSQAR